MLYFVIVTCLLQSPQAETPAVREPGLMKEIQERVKKDQAARTEVVELLKKQPMRADTDPKIREAYQAAMRKMWQVDAENVRWLKEVVAKHGWPGKSMVGQQAAFSAWLLVQHCDRDRDFQELCLEKMKTLPKGEVEPRNIAYLTDRVLVGRGKKQLYGTQCSTNDGKSVPLPIEDEANVEQRRKEMGLGTLAAYLVQMNRTYGTGEGKK
jgi:hypothetical protein